MGIGDIVAVRVNLLVITGVFWLSSAAYAVSDRQEVRLHSIQDGDSFTVQDLFGKRQRIRLAGVDAPELEQLEGHESMEALEKLLRHGRLQIEVRKQDPFGRLVARVFVLRKGRPELDVARALLNGGHVWVFNRYVNEQPANEVRLDRQAEQQARAAGRGLWANPIPQAPWDFRREQVQRSSLP